MIRRRKSVTRLAVEELEPRWVPAGNVTSTLTGSGPLYELSLAGDNAANQVRLIHVSPREVQIVGEGTTLIDGLPMKTITLPTESDFIGTVRIDLGNGDDSIIQEAFVDDSLFPPTSTGPNFTAIHTGLGDDSVTVFSNWISALWIDTGHGKDSVVVTAEPDTFLRWEVIDIRTRSGADTVLIQTNADDPAAARLTDRVEIETEEGDDVVRFDGTFFHRDFDIFLGSGNDQLIGDGTRSPIQTVGGTFFARGDDGNDSVKNSPFFGNTAHLTSFEEFV
jgi:hypothetical protein